MHKPIFLLKILCSVSGFFFLKSWLRGNINLDSWEIYLFLLVCPIFIKYFHNRNILYKFLLKNKSVIIICHDDWHVLYSILKRQCYSNKTNYSMPSTMTLQNILIIVFSSKIFPLVTILISCGIFKKLWIRHKYINLPIKVHYPNGNSIFNFLP